MLTFTDISDLNKREQALEKARKDAGWSPPRQRPRRKINWPATVRIRIASINKSLREHIIELRAILTDKSEKDDPENSRRQAGRESLVFLSADSNPS